MIQLTTLVGELQPQAAAETAKAIAVWNRDLLLGAFALRDDRQLYHCYCLTVPRCSPPAGGAALALTRFRSSWPDRCSTTGTRCCSPPAPPLETLCAMD